MFIDFSAIDDEKGTENINSGFFERERLIGARKRYDGSGAILSSTFCARDRRQVKHL